MEGKTDGPVMCEEDGALLLPSKVEDDFHNQLAKFNWHTHISLILLWMWLTCMVYPDHHAEAPIHVQLITVWIKSFETCKTGGS
eukprot:11452291-Ditylum_brightwellii.AAC.1